MAEKTTVVLTDAALMRAIAHPLRMRIVGSLRLDGPATSAILARRLRTDTGQTSHHLRLLARHGFVLEATEHGRGPRGRERWWKAAHESTRWEAPGPEAGAAEAVIAIERAGRAAHDEMIDQFHVQAAHRQWSPEWLDAAGGGDLVVRATPERLRRLMEQLEKLVEEADHPEPGAETVVVMLHAYPRRRQP